LIKETKSSKKGGRKIKKFEGWGQRYYYKIKYFSKNIGCNIC
jgi:hypothetical protein